MNKRATTPLIAAAAALLATHAATAHEFLAPLTSIHNVTDVTRALDVVPTAPQGQPLGISRQPSFGGLIPVTYDPSPRTNSNNGSPIPWSRAIPDPTIGTHIDTGLSPTSSIMTPMVKSTQQTLHKYRGGPTPTPGGAVTLLLAGTLAATRRRRTV